MQNCLIIDEEDQTAFIDELKADAKGKGFSVSFIPFNPANHEWLDFNTNPPTVDIDTLKMYLEDYLKLRIDLVISDYDFKIRNIDGFELLRWIRTRNKKAELILYSGKGDFTNSFISEQFARSPNDVKKIIQSKISEIITRDDRKGVLFNSLMNSKFDTDLFIKEELLKFPQLKFQNSYPLFEGLTVAEIIQCITDDSKQGFAFKKYILELTIAHLISLEQ